MLSFVEEITSSDYPIIATICEVAEVCKCMRAHVMWIVIAIVRNALGRVRCVHELDDIKRGIRHRTAALCLSRMN